MLTFKDLYNETLVFYTQICKNHKVHPYRHDVIFSFQNNIHH